MLKQTPIVDSSLPLSPTPTNTTMTFSQEHVEVASNFLEKYISHEENYKELVNLLSVSSTNSPTCSGNYEYDYVNLNDICGVPNAVPELAVVKRIPLPLQLLEQFSSMQCSAFHGLFPEISRAWVAVDSQFFCWNYTDGSDLAYYERFSESIIQAALVVPKAGVFQPEIHYLLCLCTAVEVALLGVTFSSSEGEIQLLPEPLFWVSSDNIQFADLCGTADGRIFLAGKDGCVHELLYQAEDGWFGRKCRKVNRTQNHLVFLLPSLIRSAFSPQEPLVQICVDDTRHLLYARTDKGSIQLFDLGSGGQDFTHVADFSYSRFVSQASAVAQHVEKSALQTIVHISPLLDDESSYIHLVAITSAGVRVYFSTTTFSLQNKPQVEVSRPSGLTMVHVRLVTGAFGTGRYESFTSVHAALHFKGVLLLAAEHSKDSDNLICLSNDLFGAASTLIETSGIVPDLGHVWALARIGSIFRPYCGSANKKDRADPPYITWQHQDQTRHFVVLTSQGTCILQKFSPVQQLRSILQAYDGDSQIVRSFFALLRAEQACALALNVASTKLISDKDVVDEAIRAVLSYGGSYSVIPHGNVPSRGPSTLMNTMSGWTGSTQTEACFTARLASIYLFAAHILRPVWTDLLVLTDRNAGLDCRKIQVCSSLTCAELRLLCDNVTSLRDILRDNISIFSLPLKHSHLSAGDSALTSLPVGNRLPRESPMEEPHSPISADQDLSARMLLSFLGLCSEVLALWRLIAAESHIDVVFRGLPPAVFSTLTQQISLKYLVLGGGEVIKYLTDALIQQFGPDRDAAAEVSGRLRDLCPSLFSADDLASAKASQLLSVARSPDTPSNEKQALISDALDIYKSVVLSVPLAVVCSQLSLLRSYYAILDLCICAASKFDPGDCGLRVWLRPYSTGYEPDPQSRRAFNFRVNCYKFVLQVLEQLYDESIDKLGEKGLLSREEFEQFYRQCVDVTDRLFKFTLYEWLLSRDLADRLLDTESPDVELLLRRAAETSPTQQSAWDLLWRYYEMHSDYMSAVRILYKLAERFSPDFPLVRRIEYLSRASVCLKAAAASAVSEKVGFQQDLQDKLEVAMLQKQLYDVIAASSINSYNKRIHLTRLDSDLLDISTLYSDFAEVLNLPVIKLAIIHTANHNDPGLVDALWREIISQEFTSTSESVMEVRMASAQKHFVDLIKLYSTSEKHFPIEYVARCLEEGACAAEFPSGWVIRSLLIPARVPLSKLRVTYESMCRIKNRFCTDLGFPWHITRETAVLMEYIASNIGSVPEMQRRELVSACLDLASLCIIELQSTSGDVEAEKIRVKLSSAQLHLRSFDKSY